MHLQRHYTRNVSPVYLLAAVLMLSSAAHSQLQSQTQTQASTQTHDAQVEAAVLRSLAAAPELATQTINTSTVYGTVTLSGSVQDEAMRQRAEQLAARTPGVQKVVDELTLGTATATPANQDPASAQTSAQATNPQLQSDGTYAPANPNAQDAQQVPPANGPNTDPYGRPLNGNPQANTGQPQYPQPTNTQPQPPYYGQQQPSRGPYGNQPSYPPANYGYGQPGGQPVTIPSGAILQVRVNQHLNTRNLQPGTPFTAMVVNDIAADGQVAIPRGTMVQGTVVDANSAGHLSGRAELGLRLNQVTLGGQTFPIATDIFNAHGGDKTIQTLNSTLGLGALGAIFGAVAGGGAGAAIGAGVGGAVGLGASAASGRGDVFIPSEAVLSFRTTQPATITTVSQAEMQRLAYGVPAGGAGYPRIVRRYPAPYPYFYGAGYYPRYYYRPYGYYPY